MMKMITLFKRLRKRAKRRRGRPSRSKRVSRSKLRVRRKTKKTFQNKIKKTRRIKIRKSRNKMLSLGLQFWRHQRQSKSHCRPNQRNRNRIVLRSNPISKLRTGRAICNRIIVDRSLHPQLQTKLTNLSKGSLKKDRWSFKDRLPKRKSKKRTRRRTS